MQHIYLFISIYKLLQPSIIKPLRQRHISLPVPVMRPPNATWLSQGEKSTSVKNRCSDVARVYIVAQ